MVEQNAPEQYQQIPRDIRSLLDELYTNEGAVIWWNAPNQLLGGQTARDLSKTPCGANRVKALLDAIADGAYF